VIHLELHTGDLPGAVALYGQLLGWRPERIRAGNGSYLTLGVGDRVGGGIVECEGEHPIWVPHVVVPDVRRTTQRAERLGGEIVIDPREARHGIRSVISTPDGGELALWQPKD
jgi:predicted enzyme related to lactoylglutathione lyase